MRYKYAVLQACRLSLAVVASAALAVGCNVPFNVTLIIETEGGDLTPDLDVAGGEGTIEGVVDLTDMLSEAEIQKEARANAPGFVRSVRITKLKMKNAVITVKPDSLGNIDGLRHLKIEYFAQVPASGDAEPPLVLGEIDDPDGFGDRVVVPVPPGGIDFLKLIRENDDINEETGVEGFPSIRVFARGFIHEDPVDFDAEITVRASGVASLF